MGKDKIRLVLLCVLAILMISPLLLINVQEASAQLPGIPEGVPRGDIIVFGSESYSAAPDNMNPWIPGNPNMAGAGAPHYEPLWYLNVTNMEMIPILASGMPEYNENYTVLTIPIRRGVYWSDGVEFTAEDVVYSINIHLNVSGLAQSAQFQTWVKRAYAKDKYIVVIELKKPNPKYHLTFTEVLGITGFRIMPKHIWENEDPLTFTNNPPVGTGPYVLVDYDPNGYWALWKRRDDWDRSALGQVVGKPKPRYLLRVSYSPSDPKQVIAISRHEMDYTELTMELWGTARNANPYITAFWKDFPYAWRRGICDVGVGFNNAKYPLNITDVRWALALAINITEVNINAYNGMARIATFRSQSVPYIEPYYVDKLLPWLKNFTLPDGYKPFDDTIPQKLAKYAESKGYTLAASPQEIFGYGWWRYDLEEATKLLESHGFYKDAEGKWHLPNGDLWTLNMPYNAQHAMVSKQAPAVAEQWRKFGINVLDEALAAGMWNSKYSMGEYDVTIIWPFCSALIDPWQWWRGVHNDYYKPIGELAASNQIRWVNDEWSELMDELGTLRPEDPKVIDIVTEMLKISFRELPHINMFPGSKLIVFDTYVWKNWPTADNWYWELSPWNPAWCLPMLVKIEHTGNVPYTKEEAPVTTTPIVSEELEETIRSTAENVQALSQNLEELSSGLSEISTKIETLNSTLNTNMTTITVLNGILIVLVIIGIVISLRKR